ncbi:MAG: hypothetical protein CVV00_13045 [Firmicutes bacterium HGW-Firmicutes-5]|nr:MAG: hypothetical protein CVV00_13045 [Firmicutes bacterium HGW-Firmicutes-5]
MEHQRKNDRYSYYIGISVIRYATFKSENLRSSRSAKAQKTGRGFWAFFRKVKKLSPSPGSGTEQHQDKVHLATASLYLKL